MMIFILAAAASFAPQPAEVRVFKDWTVACDNGWRCQAESLVVDEQVYNDDGSAATMGIGREAGPDGALTISIDLTEVNPGLYALMIDGKRFARVDSGNSDILTFEGVQAGALAGAIAKASSFMIEDSTGKPVAEISTSGASAALRYMDDRQRRAGTVSALVAKGSKGASTVPEAPALPVIRSLLAGQAETFNPTASELEQMRAVSDCTTDEGEFSKHDAALLDGTNTLIMISCGNGAYNYNSVAFIAHARGDQREFSLARFDYTPGWGSHEGVTTLVNADYNPETGTLSSYAKGRGLGDCGSSQQMVWDGSRFRLTEMTQMDSCRGNRNWITTWRAVILP